MALRDIIAIYSGLLCSDKRMFQDLEQGSDRGPSGVILFPIESTYNSVARK